MKTRSAAFKRGGAGYMLVEALVYIGLVGVVLGTGYAVMYRCVENSTVLHRNAQDVTAALNAGERWRADIRASRLPIQVETSDTSQTLRLKTEKGEVVYRFETNNVIRSVEGQPGIQLLSNAKSSEMEANPRQKVNAWQWELELLPRAKGYNKPGRVRPLFTFTAVPERSADQ
jgi:Tfp pilus assembly protein FimT